ncbi:MFS transporter, partial [Nonomuraea dietziae]|uniref:MFS transporter n=1 Tax=Nonomuraea dietziae TaxID=65515 RepID=UPI00341B6E92
WLQDQFCVAKTVNPGAVSNDTTVTHEVFEKGPPFLDRGAGLWLAGAGYLLAMFKTGMDNVLGVSLRQRMTPDPLLGRMNATFRTLLTGALAAGAAISGLIGELAGVRVTLWVGACVLATAFLPVFLSPLRTRHDLPEQRSEPPTSGGGPQQGDLAPSRP